MQADKKMPAKDRKEALADLNEALKSPAPAVENKATSTWWPKYYDKLAEIMSEDWTGAADRHGSRCIDAASIRGGVFVG